MVLFFYISIYVSSQRRSSVRKGIFKNFTKFTGKHQFWSLFFINLQAMFSYEIMKFFEDFLNTYFEEHLNNCLWIYRRYYAPPWNDFKETYKWKNQFSRWQRVQPGATFWMVNKNEWFKIHFYWYFGIFPETIFSIKNVYALFTMLVKNSFNVKTIKYCETCLKSAMK